MSCNKCNHQFCWICFGEWKPSHYTCASFAKSSEREIILRRFDANLTFRQLYIINMRNRINDDPKLITATISKVKNTPKLTPKQRDIIFDAAESVFIARQCILSLCIFGEYTNYFKIAKTAKLKVHLKKITTDLSLLRSSIETSMKHFNIQEVEMFCSSLSSTLFNFKLAFTSWLNKVQYKEREAEVKNELQ
eukprot:TRINITY_DN4568_c0_g1_i1.p1 TRINITY_DN4568_c0_g1~~TRINITY_DN4568_c0_g1_i1.p1  ORF type:complete len:192 (-),score=11.90 TRINITY_DN4568_c0_g1_i1:96-671(-)